MERESPEKPGPGAAPADIEKTAAPGELPESGGEAPGIAPLSRRRRAALEREARLKAALKANIRRRKTQARARAAGEEEDDSDGAPALEDAPDDAPEAPEAR